MSILVIRQFRLIIVLILVIGFLGCVSQNNSVESTEVLSVEKARQAEGILLKNQCRACHSIDGSSGRGPTFTGLYESIERLEGGEKIVVDEAYLRAAIIRQHDDQTVSGYKEGVMPKDYGIRMTSDEVDLVVEYIKALK